MNSRRSTLSRQPLLYLCVLLSSILTLGGFTTSKSHELLLFQILYLPVTLLLYLDLFPKFRAKIPKFFLYYSFLLTTSLVIMGLLSARSLPQLISAIIFSPLVMYFLGQILPKKSVIHSIPKITLIEHEEQLTEIIAPLSPISNPGVDFDRRAFLKLIGGAGLSVFVFSLFTKRAEAAFFGSVPGPGTVALKDTSGTKIDPAEKHPTDGYNITEIDDSVPAYYGFVNKLGQWFITKEESSGAYRYTKGTSSFSTNWTGRAALTYDYFDNIF